MYRLVPILTQSENWALSLIIDSTFWGASGSNPHPVRKLGAIDSNNLKQAGGKVPILTQSENWALYRLSKIDRRLGFLVPILTQSENWALFGDSNRHSVQSIGFQSSPSPKTGRYFKERFSKRVRVPILTQSENWALLFSIKSSRISSQVPILTQSENWALSCARASIDVICCSNPHPVRKLGAIGLDFSSVSGCKGSNPHPVRKLGAMLPS